MPASSRKLPLPHGNAPPPRSLSAERVDTPRPGLHLPARQERLLWLCLYLPRLPLEVSTAGQPDAPVAILTGGKKKPVILLCDDTATRLGVHPGMPLNAALALAPDLEFRPRESVGERSILDEISAWALRFTPLVCPDPCGALLLEIGASLPLFGGCQALRLAAIAGIEERGHVVLSAIAPTARAALWLARAGQEKKVMALAHLPGALARLPLDALGWPLSVHRSLRRMGVHRLGECMRLPRDGLARRIGQTCVEELDEALGRRPEVHTTRRGDAQFCDELELLAETQETGHILTALRVLLGRLERHLQSRQAGAQILWLGLRHHRAPLTLLRIGLLRPSANAQHLEGLAALHLAATGIPAPVTALTLEADTARVGPGRGTDLLGRESDPHERMTELVERLRMRLGLRAVHGVRTGHEHRPEHAWETVEEPVDRRATASTVTEAQRPMWMLEHPTLLGTRCGGPVLDGPLTFESGPERIETGWWDGHDVRRDYYVACNRQGRRVWVFNDRRSGGWYLHGLFG